MEIIREIRPLRLIAWALPAWLFLAAVFVGVDLPPRMERQMAHALKRRGISFLVDFNDCFHKNATELSPVICVNAPRVAAPPGFGRQILPGRKESFVLPFDAMLGAQCGSATFSLTVAPSDPLPRQEILNAGNASSGLCAFIENGRVSAVLREGNNQSEVEAAWPAKPGEFVNVTIAVSEDEALLYLNCKEVGRASLPGHVHMLPRRWVFPSSMRFPFTGVVGDAAVWGRTLSPDEVRKLCHPRRNLKRKCAFLPYCLFRASRFMTSAAARTLRAVGRLSPFRGTPATMRDEFPVLDLHASAADSRHFMRAHEKSLFNGYRTGKAENLRSIDASFNGRAAKVEAGLDDIYGGRFACRRPAFILRGDMPELLGPSGVARLYPPEAHALVHPDARDVLPLNARYVRLYEDNAFSGIYAIEPFNVQGSAWMARGEISKALYADGRPRPSDVPPTGVTSEAARRTAASIALSDNLFPWSGLELATRRRRQRRFLRESGFAEFANAVVPVETIIGDNPAPFFIVGNLNLLAAGPDVSWISSDPETVSATGVVSRPQGASHRVVTLMATNTRTGASQEYRLRVMAVRRTLPTLFLNIGGLPSKERRIDFTAAFVPDDDTAPIPLCGLAGAGGGLRLRGNTSFANGVKRSMSLKFDHDFAWPDPERPSRRLILHSGYSDATRLKNKIAFDAFGAAQASSDLPSLRFDHCEVFVNGEWIGVWEASRPVRDLVPENTFLYKVRSFNRTIWGNDDISMLDCALAPEGASDPYAPIRDAFAFVAGASDGDFASSAAERFHLDNLVGFFLILRFSGNQDGVFMNQYFAQRPDDTRIIIIPWDYDKSFLIDSVSSNNLFLRLENVFDTFGNLMRTRWRELREGVLSDASVIRDIDAAANRLAPYMDDEWRLLKPAGCDVDFSTSLWELKQGVLRNLETMDANYPADNRP